MAGGVAITTWTQYVNGEFAGTPALSYSVAENGAQVLSLAPIRTLSVLDKGVVELYDTLPRLYPMDWAVVLAARHSVRGALKTQKADTRLLQMMLNQDHSSPFEQAVFQFRLDVPVIVYWQLLRHRTARPNLESGRFRELRKKFYVPEVWYGQGKGRNKQQAGAPLPEDLQQYLSAKLEARIEQAWDDYQEALALDVVRDQARYFLPFANVYYEGVWQIDASNLMKLLAKRNASDAQTEIQEVARALETCFAKQMPLTYKFFTRKRAAIKRMVADLEEMPVDALD